MPDYGKKCVTCGASFYSTGPCEVCPACNGEAESTATCSCTVATPPDDPDNMVCGTCGLVVQLHVGTHPIEPRYPTVPEQVTAIGVAGVPYIPPGVGCDRCGGTGLILEGKSKGKICICCIPAGYQWQHMEGADPINPAYYADAKLSAIDIMEALGKSEPYVLGNVIKYVTRDKGDRAKDLRKAAWYLAYLIAKVEGLEGKAPKNYAVAVTKAMKELETK